MMKQNVKKSRMPQIGEAVFCIGYLIFALTAAVIFFVHVRQNQIFFYFGTLTLVLGGGDAVHLIPRVIQACKPHVANIQWWLGLGLLVSSISMTVFYVLLSYIWQNLFPDIYCPPVLPALIWFSAAVRIVLCLFPQNNWFQPQGNQTWSLYRNLPFAVTGACTAILFLLSGNIYGLGKMPAAILLSFICYFPVTLYAKKKPAVGMLMIPKTIAYIWMVSMCLGLIGKL